VNGKVSAGGVNVIYGSASGLHWKLGHADQFWSQDSPKIAGSTQIDDLFGSRVTAGDFNGDTYDDLAVGVQQEEVNGMRNAGGVNVIYGSASGLHKNLGHADQFWSQDSSGIDDVAETFDCFGGALPGSPNSFCD